MKIQPSDSINWNTQNGDHTYRINYPSLSNSSIVVDLGSRQGEWCSIIRSKYNPKIYCFDVIPEFCQQLTREGYTCFETAVADHGGNISLGIEYSEASIYYSENPFLTKCIDTPTMFRMINESKIDLLKINVEGAEYSIIQNLIDNDLIKNITDLQVQFHMIQEYENAYHKIENQLSKTHKITWKFPYIWENWTLIK